MFPFLMLNTAIAGSVTGGIQVAAFSGALDFASEALTGETLSIYEEEISEPDVGCYDAVGVQDLNLTIPLNSVDL